MAAANTDKWRKKKSNFSTTLNGAIGAADATIVLSSTAGLPTDTAITLTIDRVDANGLSTPTLKERVTGVVSGNNLTNCLRGEDGDGGVGKSHSSGAVVEDIWDADTWNDAVGSFLTEHNQDGTHLNTIVALLAGAQIFTGAKTFGSGLLLATSPKITTSIDDANGNEVIKTPATVSAVNELTVTNAATGGDPLVQASGGDTNISLALKAKGTGKVKLGTAGLQFPNADGSANQVLKTDGSGVLSFVAASGGAAITMVQNGTNGTLTTQSTTFVDITNAVITLTPSSATNSIHITVSGSGYTGATGDDWQIQILRDSTPLTNIRINTVGANNRQAFSVTAVDLNVTAAAHTYKVQAKVAPGTSTLNIEFCTIAGVMAV